MLGLHLCSALTLASPPADPRLITTGLRIPGEHYCDQPYVVVHTRGNWLVVMTTGRGVEGEAGQHVIAVRTTDRGHTWSEPVDIEPATGPEASWALPFLTPGGRIYVFYTYNTDNLRSVITDVGPTKRVDTLGDLMFRFSDDGGRSWSAERYRVPVREFECDRTNPYGGKVRFFWQVGKPIAQAGRMYLGLHKVGRLGEGFMCHSEGAVICSDNLLTEPDPNKLHWETLPDGDIGLRAPAGPIADEHNLVPLNDGGLFMTYRTVDGHPCQAYSHDGGHTWSGPEYMTYTPGGRLVKHPRAANFVKKFRNGKYLHWFHNHGGRWYDDRNPAWLLGGVEIDGKLHWSQPEILLYDDDPRVRMSYPDFIEDNGRYYFTETQKEIGRVHVIDRGLLEGVWGERPPRTVAGNGLVAHLTGAEAAAGAGLPAPKLPPLEGRGGFSLELWVRFTDLAAGQALLDGRGPDGKGLALLTTPEEAVAIVLNDGRTECRWRCDRGLLRAGEWHHVVATVDGGPKIITFVVDGVLCDGGEERQFGWGRFSPLLRDANGADTWRV
ncbi:MAG: exo-alpha-sialidase, partial [Armatimonadetes bacterium]|nr:exo-alpha-sialidase [Armatimonadota bacterium]